MISISVSQRNEKNVPLATAFASFPYPCSTLLYVFSAMESVTSLALHNEKANDQHTRERYECQWKGEMRKIRNCGEHDGHGQRGKANEFRKERDEPLTRLQHLQHPT
jgi:hypothetical protein